MCLCGEHWSHVETKKKPSRDLFAPQTHFTSAARRRYNRYESRGRAASFRRNGRSLQPAPSPQGGSTCILSLAPPTPPRHRGRKTQHVFGCGLEDKLVTPKGECSTHASWSERQRKHGLPCVSMYVCMATPGGGGPACEGVIGITEWPVERGEGGATPPGRAEQDQLNGLQLVGMLRGPGNTGRLLSHCCAWKRRIVMTYK